MLTIYGKQHYVSAIYLIHIIRDEKGTGASRTIIYLSYVCEYGRFIAINIMRTLWYL